MKDKYKGEKVLVIPTNLLTRVGIKEGISGSLTIERELKSLFESGEALFCNRTLAEKDESLKQIIPYVIFKRDHMVFSYVRGKGTGEKRLKGNRSIGVGGHINPADEINGDMLNPTYEMFKIGMLREIDEEVDLMKAPMPRPIAFINDNSNPVGRVHLGVVHICDLFSQSVQRKEEQISESGFFPLTELDRHSIPQTGGGKREQLESWSLLCVDYLTG